MPGPCFTSEIYALHAIGSLDGADHADLESHLERGCEACRQELQQARQFWTGYAAAVPTVAPRPAVKHQLLARLEPRRTTAWWMQWAAAVLILAIGIGVGWQLHRPAPQPQAVKAPPAAPAPSTEIRDLQAKVDDLNRRLADREKQLQAMAAPQPRPPEPVTAPPANPAQTETIAQLQAENAQRAQLLQQAQDRAAQLTAELQRVRDQAATAAESAAAERKQSADRESRLRADYAARIRSLEAENEKFQRVIADQQRRIDQNQRLVSFFASPNLRFYQYKGTRNSPAATAHVVVEEGGRAIFYAFHLPQLPAGRTYQLWLIRGQSPAVASGGTFRVDAGGNAVVEFANPTLTRDVRQFAVTDEPAAGSNLPTGSQYFRTS